MLHCLYNYNSFKVKNMGCMTDLIITERQKMLNLMPSLNPSFKVSNLIYTFNKKERLYQTAEFLQNIVLVSCINISCLMLVIL